LIEKFSDSFSDLVFSQNKEDIKTMQDKKIADKKTSREVKQGIIDTYIHPDFKTGVLLEIRCESSLGIDRGGGDCFYVLKTEQWALDSIDDLKKLFDRIKLIK
jgi:hypothetical protein